MQIAPNSTIILYSGMPMDNTYHDTLYFPNIESQTGFFQNTPLVKRRFDQNTYQRVNLGQFEAKCLADDIYDVNYMAFRNTNFGNKWFYAFVTSVEYINNGNALVTYEIDVMQTYWFDCQLEECYVEREHQATDVVGDNILPEPISVSEYVFDAYGKLDTDGNSLSERDIVVVYVDTDGQDTTGRLVGGVYSGAKMRAFRATTNTFESTAGVSACAAFLAQYIQKPDSILAIYMAPHWVTQGTDTGWDITTGQSNDVKHLAMTLPPGFYDYIGSHRVKNKKLFTYPYCYLHLDNACGSSMSLRYEFFGSATPTFDMYAAFMSPMQVTLNPTNYKGTTNGSPLLTESLTLAEYPLCSWNYDTYRAWLAQNTVPMILRGIGSVAGAAMSGEPSGLISTGLGMASDFYSASIQADTIRGNLYNGNASFAHSLNGFYAARARVTEQDAIVIDNFFDRYGYACKKNKVPNRAVRPHWTYTKTAGCSIIGQCPADDIKKICSIYDAGITFWRRVSEVGNYSLDNSPT